ncbi:MAG: hypothetical protein IJ428_02345 [Clostridia bacterium]|nr:hypothetical protein [Clostridia bacterium]
MKRILSSVLLLSMLAAVTASCAKGDTDDAQTTDTQAAVETEAADPAKTFELEEGLDYNETTLVVLTAEGIVHGIDSSEEGGGNVIKQAVYDQFRATEERLNVKFEYIDVNPFAQLSGLVSQSINAQSDDYQLVFGVASNIIGLVNEGYFLSVNELPHVNLDKVWWNRGYIESVSINSDNPYILFGDISYNMIERTCAMFFNKRMMEELNDLTDTDIYDIVLNGEWTLDKFTELAVGIYRDDNGNTQNDIDDIHAVTISGAREFEFMAFSAGLRYTDRDEDGYPVLNLYTDSAITLTDKLLSVLRSEDTYLEGGNNNYADLKFAGGKALFMPSRLFLAGWGSLREMSDDFGIIPMPKLDETVDGYYSTVGNAVEWGVVPVTVADPTMISAVAESLAYEGYERLTPVYYENSLKLKYTRGDADTESRILDLITQSARTDFIYLNKLGGIGNIFATAFNTNQNNFSSTYAAMEPAALQTLADMIEADMENQ